MQSAHHEAGTQWGPLGPVCCHCDHYWCWDFMYIFTLFLSHFSDIVVPLTMCAPQPLQTVLTSCRSPSAPTREAPVSSVAAVSPGWRPPPCVPRRAQPVGGVRSLCLRHGEEWALIPPRAPRPTPLPLDFPGACYLRGRGCDFHPGGVGASGPHAEDTVLGGDAGDLQAPGVSG